MDDSRTVLVKVYFDDAIGRVHFGIGEDQVAFCGRAGAKRAGIKLVDFPELKNMYTKGFACPNCIQKVIDALVLLSVSEKGNGELLGFKALSWNEVREVFYSPRLVFFKWPRFGYVEAQCGSAEYLSKHLDLSGHVPSGVGCTCGIYAAANIEKAGQYQAINSTVVAIRAMGETDVWSEGFRCEAAQVVAVTYVPVNKTLTPEYKAYQKSIAGLASEYFGVPLLDSRVLAKKVRDSWFRSEYTCNEEGEWEWKARDSF